MSNHGPGTVRSNAARAKAYENKKMQYLSEIQKLVKPESWPGLESSLVKASPRTLENTLTYAKKALEGNNKVYWSPDGVKITEAVNHAVRTVLDNARSSKAVEGLGTTVEDTSGADTEEVTGSDTKQTIVVPPPRPSVSRPASPPPGASSIQRPQKKQKLSNEQYVDITHVLSLEEQEQQRKRSLDSVDGRAKRIISQLTKDDERLNDDTIYIISQTLKLSLPSSKAPIQILDTTQFDVDGEAITSKLKNDLNWDEDIYAPLHHSSSSHWTLCVLSFEPNYKVESESELGSKSIRLDFYDSLEDVDRLKKVESFFQQWIKDQYPEYRMRFNRQVCN